MFYNASFPYVFSRFSVPGTQILSDIFYSSAIDKSHYTNSLSCNFIVKARSTQNEPWFEGQCSVDGVPFLQYDNNKATPLGDLGKEVDSTKAWTHLIETLKSILEELRKQLLSMEPMAVKTKGHHTLQVTTISQYKGKQLTTTSWNFTMGEQNSFFFFPNINTWGVTHDADRGTMKQWQTNRELVQDLRKFSMGDASRCLKEFLKHWKEMPRPTSRAPDINQLSPAIQPLDTRHGSNNSKPTTKSLDIHIIIIIIFIWICIYM